LNELITTIRREFDSTNYKEVDVLGSFVNESNNIGKTITPGSVYGFFVSLNEQEKTKLFEEAREKKTLRPSDLSTIKPIIDDLYPLYWGKDKSLGSRINAHITNPISRTGLARLSAYTSLHGKSISCLALVVNDYSMFEEHLKIKYPDILKTKSRKL
jgi:hypothetical protein